MRFRQAAATLAGALLASSLVALPAGAVQPADPVPDAGTTEAGKVEDLPVEGLSEDVNRDLQRRAKQEQAEQRAEATRRRGPRGRGGRGPVSDLPESNPAPAPARDYTTDPLVGQEKVWLALDDVAGQYYTKEYRLAAVGDHIEIWVALEEDGGYDAETGTYTLPFPEGDCRNTTYDGARVQLTEDQLNQLVADFDLNIYPLETEYFRTPPDRNGAEAVLPGILGLPQDYYTTEGGAGRTVTLIDNVRDDNYYTPPDVEPLSYIAGFFSSQLNAYYDRNVMTVDSWDWLHRTGANPPDDGSTDPCLNASANPFLYEGTFAHEWQHLLQSYTGEVTWLNEGLSDWAQTLTGYVDPSAPITDPGYDSHIQCFYGYLAEQHPTNQIPREDAGPENSLTWWEDQGFDEILCDYGAAYTMVEYLVGQFGTDAATFLHNDAATGFASVQNLVADAGDERSALDVLHDWAAMIALDGGLDDNRGKLKGGDASRFRTPTLDASVRWSGDDAYDTPGAPPNGSDYVRLRDGERFLSAKDLRNVTFTGAAEYEPAPVEWTVDVPDAAVPDDPAFYSGSGDSLDRTFAFETAVPDDDATLTFDTRFDIEYSWDFGFVQVSTDGGQTWQSLPGNLTTTDVADNPSYPEIAAQLPGLSGTSRLGEDGSATYTPEEGGAEWVTASYDLSAYAGQDILLGFRYMTDGAYVRPGWWVDDIAVGDTLIADGSSLEGMSSYGELAPDPVHGWTLQLVSIDERGRRPAGITRFEVAPGETLELGRGDLRRFSANNGLVGAIVTLDEPTESILQYAPYTLEVNGVVQPGGG